MRENPLLRAQIASISERYPAETLTVSEAAKLLGVGKTYVYDHYGYLVKSGRIAKVRLAAEILKEN